MELYIDNRTALEIDLEPVLEELLNRGLDYANLQKESIEISLSFVTREEIRSLNKEYRGIDSETDVLSFPFYDASEDFPTNGQAIALGDIIICPEIAKAQADTYGHSFLREAAFLTVHGFLHLIGYDHNTPADEKKMRQAQREILGVAGA